MELGKAKHQQEQQVLWDWVGNIPFHSMAQARPYTGDFFEEATKYLVSAQRMDTTGTCCPDLGGADNQYWECKSVGRQRQGLIYQHNIEKYQRLAAQGGKINFVFWFHTVQVSDSEGKLHIPDLFSLRAALADKLECVLIVPFHKLAMLLEGVPIKVINFRGNRLDWTTRTDMPGRRIPYRNFRRLMSGIHFNTPPMKVYGVQIASKPLFLA